MPAQSRWGRWAEVALLCILATQIARLIWALFASTGPIGDWRAKTPVIPSKQAQSALFASMDPFYRQQAPVGGDSVQQVTSLPFKLFGIRFNEGSGLGSAIIATESGEQRSYSVGEEISPGVVLSAVTYDHVTITRNKVAETLYIDQSAAVAPAAPEDTSQPSQADSGHMGMAPDAPPPQTSGEALSSQGLLGGLGFAPRIEGGAVTGIVLSAKAGSDVFARAGFRPGDIVTQIGGVPVRSAGSLDDLRNSIKPGARLTLMVERGSATVPIALIIPDKK